MANARWVLSMANFFQNWTNTGLISANNDWSGIPSIVGFRGDGLTGSTGTDPRTIVADGSATPVNVIANQGSNVALNTGGIAEFDGLSNPVVALQGSGTASAPHLVLYLDSTGRQDLQLSLDVRDIDSTSDNSIQQFNIQYRVGNTGSWTNLPGGYIADASTGPSLTTLTHLDITLPTALNNQPDVQLRFMTTNAVGNDEWIGIDDIGVTSNPLVGVQAGNFSIGNASVTEGNVGDVTPMVFTVTRSGGSSGAVTVGYTVNAPGTNGTAGLNDFASGTATGGTLSFADGETSKTITLNVSGDARVEPNEQFTITLGTPSAGALSNGTGTGTITNDDTGPVPIYDIQGLGHRSGFAGQVVTTSGIVTGVDSNGFYLQDPTGDGDTGTSDGIFVFTSTAPPAQAVVGNAITLSGTVSEFVGTTAGSLSVTELTAPTAITVVSTNNALPAAVIIATDGSGRAPPTSQTASPGFRPTTRPFTARTSMNRLRECA